MEKFFKCNGFCGIVLIFLSFLIMQGTKDATLFAFILPLGVLLIITDRKQLISLIPQKFRIVIDKKRVSELKEKLSYYILPFRNKINSSIFTFTGAKR